MSNVMVNKLSALSQTLKIQAQTFDQNNPPRSKMAFDDWVFNHSHRVLTPYFSEIEHNIAELSRCVDLQQVEEVEYLGEIVENQLSAVIKLLHNPVALYQAKPTTTLYDELHQLKVWEARLTTLVSTKRQEFHRFGRTPHAESALLATEQRLLRCQRAIEQLKNKLPEREENREQQHNARDDEHER